MRSVISVGWSPFFSGSTWTSGPDRHDSSRMDRNLISGGGQDLLSCSEESRANQRGGRGFDGILPTGHRHFLLPPAEDERRKKEERLTHKRRREKNKK